MGKKSRDKAQRRDRFDRVKDTGPAADQSSPPGAGRPAPGTPRPIAPPRSMTPTGIEQRVRELVMNGRAAEALQLLQDTPPPAGRASTHRDLVALCLVALRRYEEAYPLLQAAVADRGADLDLNLALAETLANLGLDMHLDNLVRRIAKAYPRHQGVLQAKAIIEERQEGRKQFALETGCDIHALEKAILLTEQTRDSAVVGDSAQTIELLTQAVEVCPAYEFARLRLGVTLLSEDDAGPAIGVLEEANPRNPYGAQALAALVRVHVSHGDVQAAEAIMDKLLAAPIPEAAVRPHVAEALARLQQDEQIRDLLQRERDLTGREHFLLGAAHARRGDLPSARRELRAALNAGYNSGLLSTAIRRVDLGETDIPYFPAIELLSLHEANILWAALFSPGQESTDKLLALIDSRPDVMGAIAQTLREEPALAVGLLAAAGAPRAMRLLSDFAFGDEGGITERLIAISHLRDAKEIAENEPIEITIDGQSHTIVPGKSKIVPDQPIELPDEETASLFGEGARIAAQSPETAYDRWVAVDERYPHSARVRCQLARLSQQLGRMEVSREWLEKALQADPNSMEARIGLAAQCLMDGDLRGAIDQSRFVENATVLSVTEFLGYQNVREHVNSILQSPMADALLAQADLAGDEESAEASREMAGLLGNMQRSMALGQYLKQRPVVNLSESLTLREVLDQMDAPVLYNAAWLFGVTSVMDELKDLIPSAFDFIGGSEDEEEEDQETPTDPEAALNAARMELSTVMLDPETLEQGIPGLTDRDLKALRWLLDQGGTAPLDDFLAEFPVDPDDPTDMLLDNGIVVEGRLDGKLTRMIPVDLREPLSLAIAVVGAVVS